MAYMGREMGYRMPKVMLTSQERALLRLLVSGYTLEEAAKALRVSLPDSECLMAALQSRCGISSFTRLLVLAILEAWV